MSDKEPSEIPEKNPDVLLHVEKYREEKQIWYSFHPRDPEEITDREWFGLLIELFHGMIENDLIQKEQVIRDYLNELLDDVGVDLPDAIEEVFGVQTLDLGLPDSFDLTEDEDE